MNLSQKLFLAAALSLVVAFTNAMACSVAVNDIAQKNELVAQAATHLGISLPSVTETQISGYEKSFLGGRGASCPSHLLASATISFRYSPAAGENCDGQVKVELSQFMGELDELDGPIEHAEFSELSAACSTSVMIQKPLKVKPIKLPKKP